jgi:hypothetical protein
MWSDGSVRAIGGETRKRVFSLNSLGGKFSTQSEEMKDTQILFIHFRCLEKIAQLGLWNNSLGLDAAPRDTSLRGKIYRIDTKPAYDYIFTMMF